MEKGQKDVTIHISSGSIIKVIVISLLFVLMFVLRDLLLVVIAAVVVASAIGPVTKWFVAHKIPRLPSVMFIYFSIALLVTGAFYFLIIPLINESSGFFSSLPKYINESSISIQQSSFIKSTPVFEKISSGVSLDSFALRATEILQSFSGGLWNTVSIVFGGLISFILIIILSFYLSVQDDGVGKFLKIISPRKYEDYIIDLWKRAEIKIGLWMQGQLILAIIISVLVYLGLSLLGVKHALLLAVLAGLFELIPLFGPILAAVPAVLVSFVDGGLTFALIIAGFYLIIQQFENQLIYPLVVKKVVGLSPIVVILALVAGAQLGGFLGLLLSVPIAAVLMEFVSDLEHDKNPKVE